MAFENLARLVGQHNKCHVGVVGAAAEEVLRASRRAFDEGMANPVLVGNVANMRRIADECEIDLAGLRLENVENDEAGARLAAGLVKSGEVQALLKGRIPTWILMKEGLNRGLRNGGGLLSHVTLIHIPLHNRLLLTTDGALTPYPTLRQRVVMTRNAVEVMIKLGVPEPRVALLSAAEEVNERIPVSLEARQIAEMNRPGGELEGCGIIDGPLDVGSALESSIAQIKGAHGPVAGKADILVGPDIVCSNALTKALMYAGGGDIAACVVGGAVPIGMVSRASPAEDKYRAMLLAMALR